jgi:hypothetical protein
MDNIKPINCGCGGEAEVFYFAPDGYAGSYCVRCMECLTQSPFFTGDKEKAIKTWNRAMGAEKNSIVSVFSSEPITKDINIPNKDTVIIEPFTTDMNHVGYCKCGYLVNAEWKYCPNCGASLEWQ